MPFTTIGIPFCTICMRFYIKDRGLFHDEKLKGGDYGDYLKPIIYVNLGTLGISQILSIFDNTYYQQMLSVSALKFLKKSFRKIF